MYGCVFYFSQEDILVMQKLETINYVVKILNISKQRAYELIRLNLIPSVKVGRQVRIDVDAFEHWIKKGGKGLNDDYQQKTN